jgi:hypothetical protein
VRIIIFKSMSNVSGASLQSASVLDDCLHACDSHGLGASPPSPRAPEGLALAPGLAGAADLPSSTKPRRPQSFSCKNKTSEK